MKTLIAVSFVVVYFGITLFGWQVRQDLKKTEYWGKLTSGTAIFGYCLPVLLFILLSKEHVGFIRIALCILLVVIFIWCVVRANNNLKVKPLEGYSTVLPDSVRKKVVSFYALTPFLTIFVLAYIGIILDFTFWLMDYFKNLGKKKS